MLHRFVEDVHEFDVAFLLRDEVLSLVLHVPLAHFKRLLFLHLVFIELVLLRRRSCLRAA